MTQIDDSKLDKVVTMRQRAEEQLSGLGEGATFFFTLE